MNIHHKFIYVLKFYILFIHLLINNICFMSYVYSCELRQLYSILYLITWNEFIYICIHMNCLVHVLNALSGCFWVLNHTYLQKVRMLMLEGCFFEKGIVSRLPTGLLNRKEVRILLPWVSVGCIFFKYLLISFFLFVCGFLQLHARVR